MKNKISNIAIISIMVILTVFYLRVWNTRINCIKNEKYTQDEAVYYAIKYFMNDEFNKMNNGEINKVNLKELDVVIDYTKEYSNLNEYFKDVKTTFIETKDINNVYDSKTLRFNKKGCVFYDIKELMIKDNLNKKFIKDWEMNQIE